MKTVSAMSNWRTACASSLAGLIGAALFLQTTTVARAGSIPAFVQESDNQVTSGQSDSVTFSSATTAGNLIAVYVVWDNTGSVSVSDSLGNSYKSATSPVRWSNNYNAQIFYAIGVRGGRDTVTATFATGVRSFGAVYAHEYSGINNSAPVD